MVNGEAIDLKIREAVSTDAKGIAIVQVDSWRTTYKGIVPDKYLEKLSYSDREKVWQQAISKGKMYVADVKGKIVGFAIAGNERSENYPSYGGEVYAIYLLKEYQGKGIGSLLMKPIVTDFLHQQIDSMIVCVLEDNDSRFFYERLGAKQIDSIEIEIGGKKLTELVYGWDNIDGILE